MGRVYGRTFSLSVLGGFELLKAGTVVNLPTGKLACLLSFLACTSPRPQSRDKLATMFWGGSNDESARHNLRQALSRIRRMVAGDALLIDGEKIALEPALFDCDAVRLDRLIREASPSSLAEAVDLYEGPLLDGVVVKESAWNDWLTVERERLSELAIGAMVRLGEQKLGSEDVAAAWLLGQRAVTLDPLREDGHRLTLRALAAMGRKSEAFRHYQNLVDYLKAELLAEPDDETRSLVARFRSDPSSRSSATTPEMTAPAATPAAPSPAWATPDGGAALKMPPPAATGTPKETPPGEALERRQVTVLVASPSGAALRAGPADAETAHGRIIAFHQAVSEVAARFGGTVAPAAGEAAHVYFGYPVAGEHDASNAVRAATALVRAVAERSSGLTACATLATGLVIVGGGGGFGGQVVTGDAPARADRLQALARPGEIVVCRATQKLLGRRFDVHPVIASDTGGAPHRPRAWKVRGERYGNLNSDGGAGTPDVLSSIREEEMELLLRRWDQARRGEGRLVLISGEAGIGKSHLAEGLLRRVKKDRPVLLKNFCLPHGAMQPLHPYIAQLSRRARLSTAGSTAEKLDRLEALIAPESTEAARDMALAAELLSIPTEGRYPNLEMDPRQKRELAMAGYLRMLESVAAQRPVVLLFEDIHDIDPTSLDLLDRTVALIPRLPVLVIVTCRPEHRSAWVGQAHVTMIHLNRLDRRDAADIIGAVARNRMLPGPVVEQIIEQADGVPLFIKELSRHVIESGLLDKTAHDPVPPGMRQRLVIPTTLRGSLIARLDRLGPAKEIALIGSAIGRSFSYDLVAAVFDGNPEDLEKALGQLSTSGLLECRGIPPAANYRFTHVLVRDAAYSMMLKTQRRGLHSKIAAALLEYHPEDVESSPGMVARHLSEAGHMGEASDYWIKAAQLAQKRGANRECSEYFGLAMDALGALVQTPAVLRQEIDLRFELKNVLIPMGRFGQIREILFEARAFAETLKDRPRLCQFHINMCQSLTQGGAPKEAIAFGLEAREIALSLDDPILTAEATVLLAMTCIIVMDYERAERLFLSLLPLLDRGLRGKRLALTGYPEISARSYLTRINAAQGEFEQGIRFGQEAMERGAELEHPYSLSVACWCLADLHLTRGDVAIAMDLLEPGLARSRQADLPTMVAAYSGSMGYALALMGRWEEGLPLLLRAMDVFDSMQHHLGRSLFLVPLAEAHTIAAQYEIARKLALGALESSKESGHRSGEAGGLRVLAEVAALSGDSDLAEEHYRNALGLAAKHNLRPLVARCRHGLGLVNLRTTNATEARDNLAAAAGMYRDMGMSYWLEKLNVARLDRA